MLGISTGEILLILGATAALFGSKDLTKIARQAGRLTGSAIAYVQLARGQFDNVAQHSQFNQINKELKDAMTQLDAIRYEIRSFSIMNPGPMTRKLMDNVTQPDTKTGDATDVGSSTRSVETGGIGTVAAQHPQNQQSKYNFKADTSAFKENLAQSSVATNLCSQASMYAKLAESQASLAREVKDSRDVDKIDDKPGLLSVLPVSAESAGLLPKRHGEVTGSDIVLEAILEAEVARNAKEFFSLPQNQIK